MAMDIRSFCPADEPAVIALWSACGLIRPWNDPAKDIQRKIAVRDGGLFVGTVNDRVIASVMAGYEGHRGWINYLAVDPDHRRSGYGRTMMATAERFLAVAGCPKVALLLRVENAEVKSFYEKLGYAADDVVCLGKRFEQDDVAKAEQSNAADSR
jgi:ribosomal protein S18 acetylase RimI-like enzyme